MTFPTSGLSDNQVHKEGNRSFVWDDTLEVWDQAPEVPDTISIQRHLHPIAASTGLDNVILDNVTLGSSVVYPAGHVIQVVTDEFNMNSGASFGANGINGRAAAAETSTSLRFSIIPKFAGSKIIVRYQPVTGHINNRISYYAIGHEVTSADSVQGTATAATMLSQLVTVNAENDDRSYFRYGEIANYSYHPIVLESFHSPSYTVGQKIWYSIFGYANSTGYFYFSEGDVRFIATEIKG